MIEALIGGIVGYLIGKSGRKTVYSTSYKIEDRYIGVVSYNTRSGKLIYFCPSCGGVGEKEYYDSSCPYTWKCKTCNGKKVLTMTVPKKTRMVINKRVKNAKAKRKKHKKK